MDSNQHGPNRLSPYLPMKQCSPKTMALSGFRKSRREPILDCFNDNFLNPFGYRATSEWTDDPGPGVK
jgi:hypothetical protein